MSQTGANTERVAVQLLQHQLDMALGLLHNVVECRDAVIREQEVIQAARDAYRNAIDALSRLPNISARDTDRLEGSIQELHAALGRLGHARHAAS